MELAALGTMIGEAAAAVPAWATTAASVAAAGVGAGASYGSNKAQGTMAKQTSEFNGQQLEKAAGDERAQAARKAQMQREQTERTLSAQRAIGASSGAGTSEGEGYLDLTGDTAARGEYYSDLELSSGENRAAGLIGKAAATRWKGDAEQSLYDTKANSELVKGAFDMAATATKKGDRFKTRGSSSYGSDLMDDYQDWATDKPRKSSSSQWRF